MGIFGIIGLWSEQFWKYSKVNCWSDTNWELIQVKSRPSLRYMNYKPNFFLSFFSSFSFYLAPVLIIYLRSLTIIHFSCLYSHNLSNESELKHRYMIPNELNFKLGLNRACITEVLLQPYYWKHHCSNLDLFLSDNLNLKFHWNVL